MLALIEGLAEAVALAEAAGLDPQLFLDAIAGGPTDAPYAQAKTAMMIARDFPPSFALAGALKDADLVLELAGEVGVEMAVTEGVRRHLALAADRGHGDEDMAATYWAHTDRREKAAPDGLHRARRADRAPAVLRQLPRP